MLCALSSYFLSCCWNSHIHKDVQVSWRCWLIWVLWGMRSYVISWRGKEWIQKFISLVSTIWDWRQMSFILLKGFLPDFPELLARTHIWLERNTSANPSQSKIARQARHQWRLNYRAQRCWYVVCQTASKRCYQYGYKEKTFQTETSCYWW